MGHTRGAEDVEEAQGARTVAPVVQDPADLVLTVRTGPPRPIPTVLDEAVVHHAGITARFR